MASIAAPPISASVQANSSPSAAPAALRTWSATLVISGPMPSPGSTAILWVALHAVLDARCEDRDATRRTMQGLGPASAAQEAAMVTLLASWRKLRALARHQTVHQNLTSSSVLVRPVLRSKRAPRPRSLARAAGFLAQKSFQALCKASPDDDVDRAGVMQEGDRWRWTVIGALAALLAVGLARAASAEASPPRRRYLIIAPVGDKSTHDSRCVQEACRWQAVAVRGAVATG